MRFFILAGAVFCALLHSLVIDDAALLNLQVTQRLNSIGSELESKTGVNLSLLTIENKANSPLKTLAAPYIQKLNSPYVLLVLSPKNSPKESGKVDIIASDYTMFDKDEVLSPLPEVGTIIPILVSNKGKDIYNAALLNGYGDIADKIAQSKGVSLESSIGNSNKTTLNLLRYVIYGSILFALVFMIIKKRKK